MASEKLYRNTLSEDFPSLGIVTERMRYPRDTSPKCVTDFYLE